MVHGNHGLNAGIQERVNQLVVELDAPLVWAVLKAAGGKDAWPRDREAVRLEPDVLHHRHVLAPLVVVVVGDVARRTRLAHQRVDGAWRLVAHGAVHANGVGAGEGVPD